MANIDTTFLTSDADPTLFDGIVSRVEFEREWERYSDKPGELFIRTSWGVPHKQIVEISKQYPDVTFKAGYSFESNRFSEITRVEYKNGVETVKSVTANYLWPNDVDYPHFKELSEKAEELFRRIDRFDPDTMSIDWNFEEITLGIEHGGYKMVVTKLGNDIRDMKVFKAHVEKVRWEQIPCKKSITETDMPF